MKPVPRWFVAVCWVLAVVFSLSAGLQVNDPDPLRWILIYMAASVAIGVLPARKYLALVALALGIIAAGWAAYLANQVQGVVGLGDLWNKMSEKGGAVEVGREAAGLAIVAAALIGTGVFRSLRA